MKEQIQRVLTDLQEYARTKKHNVSFFLHEEDNHLMRFANSSISLNTHEHLVRLSITAHDGRRNASVSLMTDSGRMDEMKRGVDDAVAMVELSQPLSYDPTIPVLKESHFEEDLYDEGLATLKSDDQLDYFNQAVQNLEDDHVKLSGIFSSGTNTIAVANTLSENMLYHKTTDAQITAVLAHDTEKWELIAEQSARRRADLDPGQLNGELSLLMEQYRNDKAGQLPVGKYNIVLGPAATAELFNMATYLGFSGDAWKRGYSFLTPDHQGKQVFSPLISMVDDPEQLDTYPFRVDFTGKARRPFRLVQNGVFENFTWDQDSADEFSQTPTGHTVMHYSLALKGGDSPVESLQDLMKMPRDRDTLYVPFLHYMNVVNPSKGLVTASSRFGALLLKADGSVETPYNIRLTQSLLDYFGERVQWLSRRTVPYNTSSSYGSRNPTAVIVPKFMQVNDLEVSHSNSSF